MLVYSNPLDMYIFVVLCYIFVWFCLSCQSDATKLRFLTVFKLLGTCYSYTPLSSNFFCVWYLFFFLLVSQSYLYQACFGQQGPALISRVKWCPNVVKFHQSQFFFSLLMLNAAKLSIFIVLSIWQKANTCCLHVSIPLWLLMLNYSSHTPLNQAVTNTRGCWEH